MCTDRLSGRGSKSWLLAPLVLLTFVPNLAATTLRVGNLSWTTTEDDVRMAFEQYGEVSTVRIDRNPGTGRSLQTASVDMPDENEARAAAVGLNDSQLDGNKIVVRALLRPDTPGDGFISRNPTRAPVAPASPPEPPSTPAPEPSPAPASESTPAGAADQSSVDGAAPADDPVLDEEAIEEEKVDEEAVGQDRVDEEGVDGDNAEDEEPPPTQS